MWLGFFYLSLAVVTVIFTICALRTNVVFVAVLFLLSFTFATGAGAYFEFALGNIQAAERLVVVSYFPRLWSRLALCEGC